MVRTRRWISLWAGLMLFALGVAAQSLLWFGGPTLRPAVGPFTLLTYLGLVALCNRTRMTVRAEGVELRRGPLPTGVGSEWIAREAIAAGGLPPKQDRRVGVVTVVWMLLSLAALGSAVVLEYRR